MVPSAQSDGQLRTIRFLSTECVYIDVRGPTVYFCDASLARASLLSPAKRHIPTSLVQQAASWQGEPNSLVPTIRVRCSRR